MTGRVVAAVMVLLLAVGCAPVSGGPEVSAAVEGASGSEYDTFSLIAHAVAEGRIDYSTGMLYRVYAQYDPMSLPDEFQSDAIGMTGAPIISEIERNWYRILPEHRAEISQYIEPILDLDDSKTQLDSVTPERLDQERNRID